MEKENNISVRSSQVGFTVIKTDVILETKYNPPRMRVLHSAEHGE